jgi:hypothetical protein
MSIEPNKWAKYMTPEEQTQHAISEALVNVPILCSIVGQQFRNKDTSGRSGCGEARGIRGPAPVAAEGLRQFH